MALIVTIIHVIISLALIVLVMLQAGEGGLGSAFGGGMVYHTKRGVEKVFMYSTILLTIAFALTSIISVVI